MASLEGQRVLVVGGSSGIGLGAAERAASAGARVTIASRSAERLRAAEAAVGYGAVGRVLDTRDAAAVEGFFADGGLWDHVVVSASQTTVAPVRELPLADAYGSMDSKFWGAYRVARAAPIRPGGSLTLVSGFLAVRPRKGRAIQGAINAAVEGLTRGLALELAPVRVNCVSPGFVDTPLTRRMWPEAERAAQLERMATGLPAGLIGQSEHVAIQIEACMVNPYMTGSIIYLDGGGMLA